jgi:putative SOS response-associated peptidase YedK
VCGRYSASFTPEELGRRFDLAELAELRLPAALPRFNVPPAAVMPVVVERSAGRGLYAMRWGFEPPWVEPGRAPPPINARAETVAGRRLFRQALAFGRCLVPATGFYEWASVPGQRRKAPYHARLREGALFAFAGIFSPPSDEGPGTYAIVTTEPNGLLASIHDRMPVILAREAEALWLDPSVTDPASVLPLLRPFPAELMEAYAVGEAVGSTANDGPELVAPLGG